MSSSRKSTGDIDKKRKGESGRSSSSSLHKPFISPENDSKKLRTDKTSTDLVLKTLPATILISRKGNRYEINTPSTFIKFKHEVDSLDIISSKNVYFIDLSNRPIVDEIGYQQFLTSQNNIIIVYTDKENPLEHPEEMMVDVTPSKSILLKAGTSDYTAPNAFAEFIDNAIQAVRSNPAGEKTVKITVKKPGSNGLSSISFWDNGCGMSKDDLQRWATMGMSQADLDPRSQDTVSSSGTAISDKTATGLISRFGVGAKKAAFYLGTEILVTTKLKVNDWVNEAVISLDILSSTGDQDWKIPITVRPSTREERSLQFTEVKINHVPVSRLLLTPQSTFDESIASLKRDLAHIYFYYIHPDPNNRSHYHFEDANADDDDDDDDSSDNEKQSSKPIKKGEYNLLLNGQDLVQVPDSMESLYIKYGKRTKHFELQVDTGAGDFTTIKCYLRYFPFLQEQETLPVPYRIALENPVEDIRQFPLSLRKPGFEVFWNGRLIPDAHIERLGFMSTGGRLDGEKIEEKYAQRVKGALFLTSSFPVNQNKTHIIKDNPIFLNLEKSGSRNNHNDWKKWILRCHKMDQDFQFEVDTYDATTNRTHCKAVSIGGVSYQKEDPVSFIKRPPIYGIIKSMYFFGVPDSQSRQFLIEIDRLNYKPLDRLEQYPISKLKGKLTVAEYEKMHEHQRSRLPSRIKIIEADKSPIPKKEYKTGDTIQWVSVALLDSGKPQKEVEKRIIDAESIKIDLKIVYQPNNETVLNSSSSSYYETGRASFRLNGTPIFNRSGGYVFTFTCSYPNVKPATHYINVVAGKPHSISAQYNKGKGFEKVQIDSPLPTITLTAFDDHSNEVMLDGAPEFEYTGLLVSSKSAVRFSKDFQVSIVEGKILIENMQVITADLGGEVEEDMVISFKFKGMSCVLDPIKLVSGPPASIQFGDDDPFVEPIMNLSTIQPFTLVMKDRSGNLYIGDPGVQVQASQKGKKTRSKQVNTLPKEYILAASTVLDEEIMVTSDVNGYFNFQDAKALHIREKPVAKFESSATNRKGHKVPIQFTFFKDTNEVHTIEKQVIITPSSKPAHLKLIPLSEISMIKVEEDSYRAMSGSFLQFGIKVYSAGGGGRGPFELSNLKAKVSTSWDPSTHNKEISMNGANVFELPALVSDKTTRATLHWVSLKLIWELEEKSEQEIDLKKEFSVQTTGGIPSTFFSQFGKGFPSQKIHCDSEVMVDLKLNDKRGNFVTPAEAKGFTIDPYFVLKGNDESQIAEIRSCVIEPFNTEKNMYPCRIRMVGYGELTLIAKDRNNNIAEFPLKFKMIEGSASQVRANGLAQVTITCSTGEYVEEIKITTCDTIGNVISCNGIEVEYEWIGQSAFQIKPKPMIRSGVGLIKNLDINCPEGTYELRVSTRNISMQPATIFFVVKGLGSIQLHNPSPIAAIANTLVPPIKISIINHSGQAMIVQQSNVRLFLHHKSFPCLTVEQEGSVYVFDTLVAPRKSGEYPLRFIYTSSSNKKVELETTLIILHDKPSKLHTTSTIVHRTSSVLAKNFVIQVVDEYDNRIMLNGAVQASIEVSKEDQHDQFFVMPVLMQSSPVQFDSQGDAVFPLLSMRESVGISQAYRIKFVTDIADIKPYSTEFVYTNSKEDIDKKVELESQRVSLNRDINEALHALETIKSKLMAFTSKKEQLKMQIEDSKHNLLKYDPTFEKSKANPDEVKKAIQSIQQEIDKMSSAPRRQSTMPVNPISKEMSVLARSSTEETGIVGLVMDLFCLESQEEARVVSKMIGRKMETVVVLNKEYLDRYYNRYKSSRNPVYFLSLDLISPYYERDEHNLPNQDTGTKLPLRLVQGAPTNGFVDFLVNRVQMKDKHERLRRSLGWTIFRDTLVFQSLKDAYAYREYCMKMRRNCGSIIALNEGELVENSGMVMVGKKDTSAEERALMGQLPISESPDFARLHQKRQLWETFKKANHEQYNFIKDEKAALQDNMNEKTLLEQKIGDLKNSYQLVCDEIKQIESKLNHS